MKCWQRMEAIAVYLNENPEDPDAQILGEKAAQKVLQAAEVMDILSSWCGQSVAGLLDA